MGIVPTVEKTIDEFRRATSCRIELDGGGTKISGPGPLQSAAAFLVEQREQIATLRAHLAEVTAQRDALLAALAATRTGLADVYMLAPVKVGPIVTGLDDAIASAKGKQ